MLKLKPVLSTIFTITILCTSNMFAKEYQVTLDDAINIALQNNQKKEISELNISIAEAMYDQALSANYPSLTYNFSATRFDEAPTFDMRGTYNVDNTQSIALYNQLAQGYSSAATNMALAGQNEAASALGASASIYGNLAANMPSQSAMPFEVDVKVTGRDTIINQLDLAMPLYTGGKISSIIKQAKLAKQIATQNRQKTFDEIVFDVKKYYYAIMLTEQLKKLSLSTLEQMKYIEQLTSNLYQGGSLRVKKTDYLRSKLSVSMVKSFHESILEKEALAKSALIFAMGLSWEDTLEIKETKFETPIMDKNLKDIIQNAYKYNPQMNTLEIAIDIQDSKIDEAKSEYYPQVGLYGALTNIQDNYKYGLINNNNKNSWSIGVGFSLNLFNGMRTTHAVEQNKLDQKKLQQQQFLLKEGLALQLKSSFLQMNSKYKKFGILDEALDIAKENKELNTRAYQEDMVETKEVIEAQLFESLTIADYYKNLHEYALSRATIDFVVSSALQEHLSK